MAAKGKKPLKGALAQTVDVKPEAQPLLGQKVKRGEITGKLWDRIRARGLQDSVDRRLIHVERDPDMKRIYGNKPVSMMGLMGPINKHVVDPNKKK